MTEKKRWSVTSFIAAFVKNTLGKKTREGNFFTERHEDGSESLKARCFGQEMDTLAVRIRGGIVLGNSRPNTVEKFVKAGGEVFVMGKVAHSGREHRDLMLNEWHVAIPNAAVSSWQVSGDVD